MCCATGGRRYRAKVDYQRQSFPCDRWRFFLHFKGAALALYLVGLFATYLRPTVLLRMFAADVIVRAMPVSSIRGSDHVLIVSLFEKEVVAKSSYYEEIVTLDGTVCTALGSVLKRHANHMLKTEEPRSNTNDVPLWNFRSKDSLDAFRDGCEHLGFDTDITLIYQARHGGAFINLMLDTKAGQDVTLRWFWAGIWQHAYLPGFCNC